MEKIGAGDRLRVAWEYCRPRGISVPDDSKLERDLKQCKKFNLEHWPSPITEEQLLKTRKAVKQGARRFREHHPERC